MLDRQWAKLPVSLRSGVEKNLGSEVRAFTSVRGGFTVGGVVGVAEGDGGRSLFLKALPAGHQFVDDLKLEAKVASGMPLNAPSPQLLLFLDDPKWVLLAFETVKGHLPSEPWDEKELSAVLSTLTLASQVLTPSPLNDLPSVADRMSGRCETWRGLESNGEYGPVELAELGDWERLHLADLAAMEQNWQRGVEGDTLLHFDLRYDNCLVTESGTIAFVDWGRACLGKPWVDLVCLLLESDLGSRNPEKIFLAHPLGVDSDSSSVTQFLVALASYWTYSAALPDSSGVPGLRDRQERSRRATVEWLKQRM